MNREKKLLINSILFFLGSMGRGVSSVILIFIASFYVSPQLLGMYDLVISTMLLIQPAIIFQINDGIYRWMLEEDIDTEEVIKTGLKILYRNLLVLNLIILILYNFINIENKLLIVLLLNINCIVPVIQQITRGNKEHKIFAISGLMNGFIVILLSIILIKDFNLGIKSFYISQIIANIVSTGYLIITQKIIMFDLAIDVSKYREISIPMQKYSLFLVPNSINQWIMKALDKYCILFYLGAFENGIYSVACRFPDILIMLTSMFYSAWVEQSITESKSQDKDNYFSKIYNNYSEILFSIIIVAISSTKFISKIIVGSKYLDSYIYASFLYVGVLFLALANFLGTGYLNAKKSSGVFYTSLIGSMINTLINILFMKKFGLIVAVLSTVVGYFSMWLIRFFQTKKFFNLKVNWKKFITLTIISMLFAILVQIKSNTLDFILFVLSLIIFIIINNKYLIFIVKKVEV